MQSLLHYRMEEEQLILKIRNQEARLRRKKILNEESVSILNDIKALQSTLAEKQLEIEKLLNSELKNLLAALKGGNYNTI